MADSKQSVIPFTERFKKMPAYTGNQRILIDAIFHEQDNEVRKAFRERMEKMARRDQLAQVSGIRDDALLDRLIELDIGPEALAALEIVPLVFVAWADNRVQLEEKEKVIALAQAAGIKPRDGRYPLLEHWLKKRPKVEALEAWELYIKDLCKRMEKPEIEQLRHELLDRARNVAQAAGGFLGLGNKISQAERAMLDELEQVFT
jgi:hypothetical protein